MIQSFIWCINQDGYAYVHTNLWIKKNTLFLYEYHAICHKKKIYEGKMATMHEDFFICRKRLMLSRNN